MKMLAGEILPPLSVNQDQDPRPDPDFQFESSRIRSVRKCLDAIAKILVLSRSLKALL